MIFAMHMYFIGCSFFFFLGGGGDRFAIRLGREKLLNLTLDNG